MPPLDRDEPRFTQATKQMLETGDFVDIRFQDEARHKKPVGIYWLQSAAASVIGADPAAIWQYRIVSFLGATAAVLLAFWAARAFVGVQPAFFTALGFAATILIGVEAHIAKTDATLLAVIVAAQGLLARFWIATTPVPFAMTALFWVLIGAGILIKGPIILLVVGGTIAALSLWTRNVAWIGRLRPLTGLLVAILVAAPWYVAIALRTEGAFFVEAVGKDLIGKIATGQESHGAPPGVHLAVMLGTFWPMAPLLVLGLPRLRKNLSVPAVRFALCWAVPTIAAFELTATKLPHYVLPAFPALSLLAIVLLRSDDAWRPPKWLAGLSAVWLALAPAAVLAGAFVVPVLLLNAIVWAAIPFLVAALAAALWAARHLYRFDTTAALVRAALASFFIAVGSYGVALPNLPALWISSQIVDTAKSAAGCPDPRIVSVGWREPSLIFLAGTDTALRLPGNALEEASRTNCVVVAVHSRFLKEVFANAVPDGRPMEPFATVKGFTLNGGDRVEIILLRPVAAP
ncbi:MAG: glycosyltransferase family 39 protein [Pseudomonadota bacterium]